jgi:hypothetical protein
VPLLFWLMAILRCLGLPKRALPYASSRPGLVLTTST